MNYTEVISNVIVPQGRRYDVVVVSKLQISAPKLGISKAYEQMIKSFLSEGLKVCLVTEGESLAFIDLGDNYTIVTVPASKQRVRSLVRMRIPHPISFWLSEISDYVSLGNNVIAPIIGMQTAIFRTPKQGEQRYFSTLHTPYSWITPQGCVYLFIQKKTLQLSDFSVANSKTIINKLRLHKAINVNTIPHSILFEEVRISNKSSFASSYIWIGALSIRKGVDRLILLLLLNRKKSKIRIVWSHSRFDFFWKLLLNKFSKFGWCELEHDLTEDQLNTALQNSSCLLSTTRFESFGLTIIEAATMGTGVIGIRAPGVTETLPEDTGGALYFKSTRKLSQFLSGHFQDSYFEALGMEASRYVREAYDSRKISRLWSQLIAK